MKGFFALFTVLLTIFLPIINRESEITPYKQYNILMIVVDDMGSLINHPDAITPNMDALFAESVNFVNAHVPAGNCNASRSSVMTGLQPYNTEIYTINGPKLRDNLPDVLTIPQYFQMYHYETIASGKVHHGHGLTNGDRAEKWDEYNYIPSAIPDGCEFPMHGNPSVVAADWAAMSGWSNDWPDDETADFIIESLQTEFDAPFFMAAGLYEPHLPWCLPEEFFDLYAFDKIAIPEVPFQDGDDLPSLALNRYDTRGFRQMNEAGFRRDYYEAYLASVSFADYQIGRILAGLEESGYADNTVVVFWSDHGRHFTKKNVHKNTLWDETTRVPFSIKIPDSDPATVDAAVSVVDLFATLTELAGLPKPYGTDSESLAPLIADPTMPWDRSNVISVVAANDLDIADGANANDLHWSITVDNFTYLMWSDGGTELYNNEADPWQFINLSGDPAFEGVETDLRSRLRSHPLP